MKGAEIRRFRFGHLLVKDSIDAAAARAFLQRELQLDKVLGPTCRNDLDMTVVGVSHPTPQAESGRLAMNKPAKADTLNAALYQVMTNHEILRIATFSESR